MPCQNKNWNIDLIIYENFINRANPRSDHRIGGLVVKLAVAIDFDVG
jgi:hypothetical protein